MRILVVGAGGIGGYFGGRLVEKGEDVTFLVRNRRKQQIEKNGLVIRSIKGDSTFTPKLMTKDKQSDSFDIVLLSIKAYHLEETINDLKPYIGEKTVIIPLLNGVAHLSPLQLAFGEEKVLGGLCIIETTLNESGEVVHTSAFDQLVFGELDQSNTKRIQQIATTFSGTKANFILSHHIKQDIWKKYLLITVMSSVTTLMRAPMGPICESDGGLDFIRSLFEEAAKIMRACHAPIPDNIVDVHMKTIENLSYDFKTSMQRDMEKGLSIEGEHLQGYLLKMAIECNIDTPILNVVYQNLKVYEKQL
ncbi:2-dehydropantoate 2-reductase [Metabacillus halosaccharovorans]|uniref:2-dehydropantoate 2-reductase n=1 Tax=Metabacillus halosaccharovorans TaxID=930124 RepID=UPI001C1FF631|nr:2-dehydropantoate 2-reductase [Metabacillus halosaccharovorans]MBU7592947.1 2-dehydropantoate 2-reductase [Metabacillus halosaccharovorans]